MGNVILDMSISLDGIVALPGDYRLHEWYFTGDSSDLIADLVKTTGAMILGRRTYDLGASMDGFVDNVYQVPHYVLTHQAPEKAAKGNTPFVFVSDGLDSALQQAKASAGDRHVIVSGGADVAQQCLKAGALDEIHLHLVPVLLGDGLRLFENVGQIDLENIGATASPGVTHLRFRVIK